MTGALTPAQIASLATNPAMPYFTRMAFAWGIVGLTLAAVALAAVVLICWIAVSSRDWAVLIGAVLFLFMFAMALVVSLPRVIAPQGFAIRTIACYVAPPTMPDGTTKVC